MTHLTNHKPRKSPETHAPRRKVANERNTTTKERTHAESIVRDASHRRSVVLEGSSAMRANEDALARGGALRLAVEVRRFGFDFDPPARDATMTTNGNERSDPSGLIIKTISTRTTTTTTERRRWIRAMSSYPLLSSSSSSSSFRVRRVNHRRSSFVFHSSFVWIEKYLSSESESARVYPDHDWMMMRMDRGL